MANPSQTLRLAAVADPHFTRETRGTLQSFFEEIGKQADVLALCGDLTHHGLPEEGELLSNELKAALRIPVVAVLGNHDYEAGRQDELKHALGDGGIRILDGES